MTWEERCAEISRLSRELTISLRNTPSSIDRKNLTDTWRKTVSAVHDKWIKSIAQKTK
jgi:hypothetical protein